MRVKNLQKTCECCPAQWEGETIKGQYVYIRCDDYDLSIEVSPSDKEWIKGNCTTVFYDEDSSYCGVMDTGEMLNITGIKLI